MSFRHP